MKDQKKFPKKGLSILLCLSLLSFVVFKTNVLLFLTGGTRLHAEQEERKESFFDIQKIGSGVLAAALAGLAAYKLYTAAQSTKSATDISEKHVEDLPLVESTGQEIVPRLLVYSNEDEQNKIATPLIFYQSSQTLKNLLSDLKGTEDSLKNDGPPKEIPLSIKLNDIREIFYLLALNESSSTGLYKRLEEMGLRQLVRIINGIHYLDIASLMTSSLDIYMKKITKMNMRQIMESKEITELDNNLSKMIFKKFIINNFENEIIKHYDQDNSAYIPCNVPQSKIKNWLASNPNPLTFNCDGTMVACGGKNQLRLYDYGSNQLLKANSQDTDDIGNIAFSPNGKQLVTGDISGNVVLWKIEENQLTSELLLKKHPSPVTCIQFSPDGEKLAIGYDEGSLFILNLKNISNLSSSELLSHIVSNESNSITGIMFSPDSKKMISSSVGGLESKSENLILSELDLDGAIVSLTFLTSELKGWNKLQMSANGQVIILWAKNANKFTIGAEIWDKKDALRYITIPNEEKIKNVALIDNDTRIAVISQQSMGGNYVSAFLHLYSVKSMELEKTFPLSCIVNVAFFNTNTTRFISYYQGELRVDHSSVKIWNNEYFSCKKVYELSAENEFINIACYDTKIVTVQKCDNNEQNALYLWTLTTDQEKLYIQKIVNECNPDQLRYLCAAFLELSRGTAKDILGICVDIYNTLPKELQNFLVGGPLKIPQQENEGDNW